MDKCFICDKEIYAVLFRINGKAVCTYCYQHVIYPYTEPRPVIHGKTQCPYCRQYGKHHTACVYCGAPIE